VGGETVKRRKERRVKKEKRAGGRVYSKMESVAESA
jgi:hypothetical protein